MAIAWSRISSKVIAHPPEADEACRRRCGNWQGHTGVCIPHMVDKRKQEVPHSTQFSGGVGHCSSKASRREDLEIEQPVACWDGASFHFHPTLASMLGATLIRYQVVEVREPGEKRLLAAAGMMESLHREQLPLDGVMGLI